MTDAIHARARPGEVELAVWRADALEDYAVWHPGRPDGFGDLHLARLGARDPITGGRFVALPGRPDGFLPDREDDPGGDEGAPVAVRVIRAPQGGKGARLSARLDAGERARLEASDGFAPGPTPFDELRGRHPDLPVLADGAALAARLSGPAGAVVGRAAFPEAAADAVGLLANPVVPLPGGARASIHPTPALVAIDVDLGGAGDRRLGRGAALVAANLALLPALASQIRLRGLGGAIVIDFGGLAARKRAVLGPALAAALARDPLNPRFLGFSALGLAEIVRAARRPPLHRLREGPHARALDAARAWRDASLAPGPRPAAPVLALSPAVATAWREDPTIEADLAAETGHRVRMVSDPATAAPGWSLRA